MNLENKADLELRVKQIDEQIALLTNLKSQSLQKLQGLEYSSRQKIEQPKQMQSDDQVALFLNYFRGRDDVYAKLWVNNRTGKRGYSQACKNEWVKIICKKPAIKCSECPNQQFFPLDETAVKQHLNGHQVVGVYPMLKNEHCRFIVMDFDKEHWMDDVRAIMRTCHEEKIPAAVERSRSGNGGHVWIFFSEEIPERERSTAAGIFS